MNPMNPMDPWNMPAGDQLPHDASRGLAAVIMRRLPTVILVTLVMGALATTAVLLAFPPKFEVDALIHVAPVVRPILFADANTDISRQYRGYMGTQVRIIKSPKIISDAIHSTEIRTLDLIRHTSDPIKEIQERIEAEHVRGTENLQLHMVGDRPNDMAMIVNAVAQSYLTHRANDEREWDDKILRSLRVEETNLLAQLKAKSVELRQLAVDDGLRGADQADSALEQSIVELNQMQIEANRDAAVAQAKLNMLNEGSPTGVASARRSPELGIALRQDPEWRATRNQLVELERAALEDERLGRGPSHPDVQARPARIAMYTDELGRRTAELQTLLMSVQVNELQQRIVDAKITGDVFRAQMQNLAEERGRVSRKLFFLDDVRHTRERIENALARVREKVWNVQVEQHRASRLTLESPATAPQEPNIDKRPQFVAAALAVCFACAVFVALVRDRVDKSVRSPSKIASRLGLPLLGSIQHIPNTNGGISVDHRMMEPVRGICTALLVDSDRADTHCRLITSPTPGNGKSTLAVNLARSLAATGRRVLLVDADNYGQGVSQGLKMTGRLGLKELLEGTCQPDQVVYQTHIENLFVLPAGARDAEFGNLIVNQDAQAVVRRVFLTFQEVIVDSPPVLSSSNTVALATMVDEILLVLRAGRSTSEEAWTAQQYLSTVRRKISGVILNAVTPNNSTYGYYGYSYSGAEQDSVDTDA